MYIRALAAVALIASLPGIWQSGLNFSRIVGPQLSPLTAFFSLFVLATTLTPVLFLAALASFDRPLHFPARLRKWSFAAIVCFAAFIVIATGQYFKDILGYSPSVQKIFGPYLVSSSPLPILPFLLGECSSAAQLLLLIAFYRRTDDEPLQQDTRLLRVAAKAAAVSLGLWAAINVTRLLAVPYTYAQLQDWAWRAGRPLTVIHLLGGVLPALLSSVAFFIMPFMVWRSIAAGETRRVDETATIITPT